MPGTHELPRSKLRGISLAEFIDLIEASFEEFDPKRLNRWPQMLKVAHYPLSTLRPS
jgi:hypothetical protein